jgi:hypothetical protein
MPHRNSKERVATIRNSRKRHIPREERRQQPKHAARFDQRGVRGAGGGGDQVADAEHEEGEPEPEEEEAEDDGGAEREEPEEEGEYEPALRGSVKGGIWGRR